MRDLIITKYSVILLAILIVLPGCAFSKSNDDQKGKGELLKVEFIDSDVYDGEKPINISIENTTSTCIQFPPNFGVTYRAKVDGNWVTVPDLMKYYKVQISLTDIPTPEQNPFSVTLEPNNGYIQYSSQDGYLPGTVFSLFPDISGLSLKGKTEIIATITGSYCDDPKKMITQDILFFVEPKNDLHPERIQSECPPVPLINRRIRMTTFIVCIFGAFAVLGYNGTGNIFELVWNFTGCVIPFVISAGVGTYFKMGSLGFD
jgi:hypothetical protein